MQTIEVKELAELCSGNGVELIDVRTPAEYREVHAEGAVNVPLDSLDPKSVAEGRNGAADQPLYVICKSGARGAKAVEKLTGAGITNAVNVDGGTMAWEQAGLPVKRGRKAISLERQVRITAGALVFAGTLAGLANPYLLIIPGFVGAGLMFAGITDTCGMAMILAKMPWNR